MRTLILVLAFLALSGSRLLLPAQVAAQGICEYQTALSPALIVAPALGALGGALAGVFDEVNEQLDQAAVGEEEPGEVGPAVSESPREASGPGVPVATPC